MIKTYPLARVLLLWTDKQTDDNHDISSIVTSVRSAKTVNRTTITADMLLGLSIQWHRTVA